MKKSVAFCFDLDGTVTRQELLPLIAKEAGIFEEISILTKITLDGLIPFENSFKLRVKLLSTVPISVVQKVVNRVQLDPAISNFIQKHAQDCYIVTGNLDVWINDLIKTRLRCGYFSSQAEYEEDTLTGIQKILNKRDAVVELKKSYHKIIAIGDSMNDCPMFEEADIQIAYGGVHSPTATLIELSNYVVFDGRSLVGLLEQNT